MVSKFSSQLKPEFRSLVLDNELTYFEELIYGSFRVDVMDIISIKAQLSKAFHVQPSEVDKMPFWEFELYIKQLEKLAEEEANQQKAEMDKAGVHDAMKMAKNPGKMMAAASSAMPKMPNMNMPKTITMPSYKT